MMLRHGPRLLALLCLIGLPPHLAAQTEVRRLQRPVANPVVASPGFRRAIAQGTRTTLGVPGPRYWQQSARYTISARLDVAEKRLEGTTRILYHNASPDSLRRLVVQLIQNFHRNDVPRIYPAEITGGYTVTRVAAAGQSFEEVEPLRGVGWAIRGTNLLINPPTLLPPHDSMVLELDWSFRIPQLGTPGAMRGRMGWNEDNLFFLAYWYPQMAVYDDVGGWHSDPFLGQAEFYSGFAEYDVTLDVPEDWLVQGTGDLLNEQEVLLDHIIQRLRLAETSDTVVHVIAEEDLRSGFTRDGQNGRLQWHFAADSVRDVAYSITRESLWDVVRADVSDRDGDGRPDYSRAEAIFRPAHERWRQVARYAQHAIAFHSRHAAFPYPYSHATAVEGTGIVTGGMEFPMMTIMDSHDRAGDRGMYMTTTHEVAHNWVPMIVSTDERRRAWMDEGTAVYIENLATADFFPGYDGDEGVIERYLRVALTEHEGALMRYSDHLDSTRHYSVHAYSKPASLLIALRHLLGTETFDRAYQGYLRTWAFGHPKPWDLFNYFNASTGQYLDWFWQTWYYETWTLDQSIDSVAASSRGTEIAVRDRGDAPMPARLTVTLDSGDTLYREIPVTTWLSGKRTASVTVPPGQTVTRVEIDAEGGFPDAVRKNNFRDRRADAFPSSWPVVVRNDLLRRRAWALEAGFLPEGTLLSGSEAHRATEALVVSLEGGVEYAIVAVCDQDCLDLDLEITSAADSIPGKTRDASPDDWPGLRFTAPVTGQYDLTLTMVNCRARTCAWGGQIFRRELDSSGP